jgi:hypothetical protein
VISGWPVAGAEVTGSAGGATVEFGSALMQPVSTVATASDSKTAQMRFRNPSDLIL